MQITEYTRNLAEEFRKAKQTYLGFDTQNGSMDDFDEVRRAFLNAAATLASSLLADIDRAGGES